MRYLVLKGSFLNGSWHPRGTVVEFDERKVKEGQRNLKPLGSSDLQTLDRVQVSPIGPTGPNPTSPQQIPPDAFQTVSGYEQPGAQLVGEVTRPQEKRIDQAGLLDDEAEGTQAKIVETLTETNGNQRRPSASSMLDDGDNDDDALVAGNIADVTAKITADTSDEELNQLEAAEKDREKPRKGVLSAIETERARRKEPANA